MGDAKPKEPLLAILLTLLLPGLGHVYAGDPRRGLLLFCLLNIVVPVAGISYVLQPSTKLSLRLIAAAALLGLGLVLYVLVDVSRSANAWNILHGLQRKTPLGKTSLLVVGILLVALGVNPIAMVGGFVGAQFVMHRIAQAFQVEQYSMEPTLTRGDRLMVDRAVYRQSSPQRGDIVVFRYPRDPQRYYLKRVVGLPSETVEAKDGRLLINGRPLKASGTWGALPCYSGNILDIPAVNVPPEHYFVLGDNCNNSEDSRAFGPLPMENLVGRAYKIYYPFARSGPIE